MPAGFIFLIELTGDRLTDAKPKQPITQTYSLVYNPPFVMPLLLCAHLLKWSEDSGCRIVFKSVDMCCC